MLLLAPAGRPASILSMQPRGSAPTSRAFRVRNPTPDPLRIVRVEYNAHDPDDAAAWSARALFGDEGEVEVGLGAPEPEVSESRRSHAHAAGQSPQLLRGGGRRRVAAADFDVVPRRAHSIAALSERKSSLGATAGGKGA